MNKENSPTVDENNTNDRIKEICDEYFITHEIIGYHKKTLSPSHELEKKPTIMIT